MGGNDINSKDLMPLLREVTSLTRSEQDVFIHCLQHCPRPVYYSADIRTIADILQLNKRTVERALRRIRYMPIIGRCVTPVRYNQQQELYHHARQQQQRNRQGNDNDQHDDDQEDVWTDQDRA